MLVGPKVCLSIYLKKKKSCLHLYLSTILFCTAEYLQLCFMSGILLQNHKKTGHRLVVCFQLNGVVGLGPVGSTVGDVRGQGGYRACPPEAL